MIFFEKNVSCQVQEGHVTIPCAADDYVTACHAHVVPVTGRHCRDGGGQFPPPPPGQAGEIGVGYN
jgi:hypothetical protein